MVDSFFGSESSWPFVLSDLQINKFIYFASGGRTSSAACPGRGGKLSKTRMRSALGTQIEIFCAVENGCSDFFNQFII